VQTIDMRDRVLAYELLITTPAVRNIIRSNECFKLENILNTSSKLGMCTMDSSLIALYEKGEISYDSMISRVVRVEDVKKKFQK